MSATNRKIDSKADPANDPALSAFRTSNRLQSLMADIKADNPIAKADRPHPPLTDLRTTTSLDTQREELQRAMVTEPEVKEPDAEVQQPVAAITPQPKIEVPVVNVEPAHEEKAPDSLPVGEVQPTQKLIFKAPEPSPETMETPVNDAAVHTAREETTPRLRGRPRVSEEKKRESSYTLSPHIAGRIRDLAALEQYRLKRTVSASEILEAMVAKADEQIKDNQVLTR
jgi:hypothetical protein